MNVVDKVMAFINKLTTDTSFLVMVAISVVAFSLLYFVIMNFLMNRNSGSVVAIFVACMMIMAGIVLFNDNMSNAMFLLVPSVFFVIVVVLYTTEIKRLVWRRRKLGDLKHGEFNDLNDEKVQTAIDEMIRALQDMSKNKVGALIVLSEKNIPAQVIDSGVKLNCDISSELIESVFFPNTPLHDGAMIIDETSIVAAGCFLPLTQNIDNIPKEIGTRHRAGLGITETIDVVSIIVSEETGIISIAKAGKLTRYADYQMLKTTLRKYYWQ